VLEVELLLEDVLVVLVEVALVLLVLVVVELELLEDVLPDSTNCIQEPCSASCHEFKMSCMPCGLAPYNEGQSMNSMSKLVFPFANH